MSAPAIDLSDLEAVFPGRRRRPVRALRGVNLRVAPGG